MNAKTNPDPRAPLCEHKRGRFITLEGIKGAGKSTQASRLVTWLISQGQRAIATREPGGSPNAEAIRNLILSPDPDAWQIMTEAFLYTAARHEHLVKTVRPALAAGTWVVCDRFVDSTMVYQGQDIGVPIPTLAAINALATGGTMPDLTIVIDLPVGVGLARVASRGDARTRYDPMSRDLHEQARVGFLTIARNEPQRCVVVEGLASEDVVAAAIAAAVRARLLA